MKKQLLLSRFVIIFTLIILSSCKRYIIPHDIQCILDATGKNKSELLKVINLYAEKESDSLKLKATYYLIKDLNKRSYLGGEHLNQYMQYPKLVLRDLDHGLYIMNSLNKMYGVYDNNKLIKYFDLEQIKATDLISNLETAFYAWKHRPWSKDYSFSQFCDFVLPFRINNEVPNYNRKNIMDRFKNTLDSISINQLDAVTACKAINSILISDGWIFSTRAAFLPNYQASTLVQNRVGTCREMSDLAIYVMRAVGIPVTLDFIPQYPYRSMGHVWNVVLDKDNKFIPFLGSECNPGTPHKPKTKKGKVYRIGSQVNPYSLAMQIKNNDAIPDFMKDPHIYDVTDQYVNTFDITLPIKLENKSSIAYLSVFNNNNWIPICWSKIESGKATFQKIEGGIVYILCFYDKLGVSVVGSPFIVREDGKLQYLNVDTSKNISKIICDRIYPIVPESYILDVVKGAKLQGSNHSDFSDATDLYVFQDQAQPFWNDLEIKNIEIFRYLRFLPEDGKVCNVAEIEFFSFNKKLAGSISGFDRSENESLQNAIDGNEGSAYSSTSNACSIIFDLGQKKQITKIRFLPAVRIIPENLINIGEQYQLKYWLDNDWKIVDTKIADHNSLVFNSLPSNALFMLNNISKVSGHRIFTIKNGHQEWW